jgi:hypothetical protein
MVVLHHQLTRSFFSQQMSVSVAEAATGGSPEELARLAVDSLQQIRIDRQQQIPANMSRRRFICIQTNSILVGLLTLLTVCILTLSRISDYKEFLFGNCGLVAQLFARHNLTTFPHCNFSSPSSF